METKLQGISSDAFSTFCQLLRIVEMEANVFKQQFGFKDIPSPMLRVKHPIYESPSCTEILFQDSVDRHLLTVDFELDHYYCSPMVRRTPKWIVDLVMHTLLEFPDFTPEKIPFIEHTGDTPRYSGGTIGNNITGVIWAKDLMEAITNRTGEPKYPMNQENLRNHFFEYKGVDDENTYRITQVMFFPRQPRII